jgi:hypothetical protein
MEANGLFHDPAALLPGKYPSVPIRQEAVWASEPVDAVEETEIPDPDENRTLVFQPVV